MVGGSGTTVDPIVSQAVSGQCSAFSRRATDLCGYYNTRFNGYGGGHVEHTQRHIRAGHGGYLISPVPSSYAAWQRSGRQSKVDPPPNAHYYLLTSPLQVEDEGSHRSDEAVSKSTTIHYSIIRDSIHRMPWRTDVEMQSFLGEIGEARTRHVRTPAGLRMTPGAAKQTPKSKPRLVADHSIKRKA